MSRQRDAPTTATTTTSKSEKRNENRKWKNVKSTAALGYLLICVYDFAMICEQLITLCTHTHTHTSRRFYCVMVRVSDDGIACTNLLFFKTNTSNVSCRLRGSATMWVYAGACHHSLANLSSTLRFIYSERNEICAEYGKIQKREAIKWQTRKYHCTFIISMKSQQLKQ